MSSKAQPVDDLSDITMNSQIDLWVFGVSLLSLCLLFRQLAPHYPTTKQHSWILTTISSAVMTVASVPFVWDYIKNGGNVKSVRTASILAIPSSRFFQAYLFADLLMGTFYYRDQVALLTGWIHHIVYVFITELAIRWSWTQIFCLCACMELPTFILASASLYPRIRSDFLFAIAFFTTRIMLHIMLSISYLLPHNRAQVTGGSIIPSTVLTFIFPLHAFWFLGCVKGMLRRANLSADTAPRSTPAPVPLAISLETSTEIPSLKQCSADDVIAAQHSSMTVPGSFSLPPLHLKLSVQRLSPKYRKRITREQYDARTNMRTHSLERA